MALILTVLVAFPLGYAVRHRTAAFVAFVAAHGFLFTFQTLSLILEWVGGDETAFGPFPKGSNGQVLAYGVVNLVIFAAGLGLVHLGGRLRDRRGRRTAVDLDPVTA